MLNGFRVGVNGSVAMAVGGHPYSFSKSQMLSFIRDPRLLAKTMLPTLEAGSPYAGMSLNQVEHNKAALAFLSVRAKAEFASSHSGMYSKFLEGLFFTPYDYKHFGYVSPFTNRYDAPTVNAMNRLSATVDKFAAVLGKQAGSTVSGTLGVLNTVGGWATTALKHMPFAGGVLATAAGWAAGMGISGAVRKVGGFLSKFAEKLPILGRIGSVLGGVGIAGEAGVSFLTGWNIGKLLDKWFPHLTGGIGKTIVGGVLGLFDATKAFFSWIAGSSNGVESALKNAHHAFSFMFKGLAEIGKVLGLWTPATPLTTQAAHIYDNYMKKHMQPDGALPVAPQVAPVVAPTAAGTTSHLHVYLHGDGSNKDIAHHVAQALKSVVTGEGRSTARPLAAGIG